MAPLQGTGVFLVFYVFDLLGSMFSGKCCLGSAHVLILTHPYLGSGNINARDNTKGYITLYNMF